MNITAKLATVSILALTIATPVLAQNPKQGDYYAPVQTTPQQLGPAQQQTKQGDYYAAGQTAPQQVSPAQEQQIQQGDYYKPNGNAR